MEPSTEYFTPQERQTLPGLYRAALTKIQLTAGQTAALRRTISEAVKEGHYGRDEFGHSLLLRNLTTVTALAEEVSPDQSMAVALMLSPLCQSEHITVEQTAQTWGDDVARIIRGLLKAGSLYDRKSASMGSDNFRKLLLTFADDIRVIILMILDRRTLMRAINHHPDQQRVSDVACEAAWLYAPLAHRLGLYKIKSDLEDMSLKYTNRDIYTRIAHKLNETKASRDAYIKAFIGPVKEALERQGLRFDIKGRTKSIYSIWNKMKKQSTDIDHIYDLFAIRIILDVPPERERSECWLAYSVVTDMYQPNPARLKDWLSIPKSNGYESLHITVKGPESKWVEVQIRSRRMDEIAEKGIAAHWKYKGIKSENNLDEWMNQIREILEAAESGPMELMKDFRMDLYSREVFVFTPKGDLYKLPLGATVLDFAFHIHSRLGCTCTGARIDGRPCRINHKLRSGDTVEVLTSSNQAPKPDWLNFTVTSKARTKIRQTINEQRHRSAELGRELLQRRMKNRKIEPDEALMTKVIRRLGYKTATDFHSAIASGQLDSATVIAEYEAQERPAEPLEAPRPAEEFTLQPQSPAPGGEGAGSDVLVIGDDVKDLNYRLARCCSPVYGDRVFGFISSGGAVKIHRDDCPNARDMRLRYPYRVIPVRWSGRRGAELVAVLRVVGHDDIGIVTNISSIINKEKDVTLRGISIESHDGMFQGRLTVGVTDPSSLSGIIKKIKTVKGLKDVQRI